MWKKVCLHFQLFENFEALHKISPLTHSPQQNKKAVLTTQLPILKSLLRYRRRDSKEGVSGIKQKR